MGLNTTPGTWTPGTIITAPDMNREIRDPLTGLQAAWSNYSPTWGASTNPAIVNGTIAGSYLQIGKTIHFKVAITMGSSTTYGSGAYTITLPVAPVVQNALPFVGELYDSSANANYPLWWTMSGSGTVFCKTLPSTAGNGFVNVTSTVPVTLATGDILIASGTYEAA